MSFFNELKRRNVFKVGIAYVIAAWVLLQVVDLGLENINAPDWVMQVFMLVAALGFPVAVIIAWAFEMTPEGIKRESEVDRTQSVTHSTGRKLDRIVIGFLALAVVLLLINPYQRNDGPDASVAEVGQLTSEQLSSNQARPETTHREKSVAVLPFAFRSANVEDKFFAEGMHDDLLTQLAKIGSLKVISRTSVMEYKDTTKKIREIAAELGVSTIIEGGVQRSGSRIRFNAQLIDAQTDEHLWAETYNRELTAENLFEIQTEITRAIAVALQATLSADEEALIERALTNNLEAWKAYQHAISFFNTMTPEMVSGAISEVSRALELDPNFTAAWSLKAILLLQNYWFYDNSVAVREAAREAIDQGRAIDPTLPELDLAEGYYYYWGYRDYQKALPLMQRAIEALPNSARAHLGKGYVLRRIGKDWQATLAAMKRGSELDPRVSFHHAIIAQTLSKLHRYTEAKQWLDSAELIEPNNPFVMLIRADFSLKSAGDLRAYSRLSHLSAASIPLANGAAWLASLYLDDFAAALEDVSAWPEDHLLTKDFHTSRPMLFGLTHLYSGNTQAARPLLLEAKQAFEILLEKTPKNYPILRSLCTITGGLAELNAAQQYCRRFLTMAPADAFLAGDFKFSAATGLALAGDAQAALELLGAMLGGEVNMGIYPVIYHPAFDGIREHPAYIALLNQYGPEK